MNISASRRELRKLTAYKRCRALAGTTLVELRVIYPAEGEVSVLAVDMGGCVVGAFGPWSSTTQLVSMLLLGGTLRAPRPDEQV